MRTIIPSHRPRTAAGALFVALALALVLAVAACSSTEPAPVADDVSPAALDGARDAGEGSEARAYRPGAPGQETRVWAESDRGGPLPHTEADVAFMQGMILHHAQALEMSAMAPSRTEHPQILTLARRIESSQLDEIRLMARWLEARGEDLPEFEVHDWTAHPEGRTAHGDHGDHGDHDDHGDHAHHDPHDHGEMHGMLTDEQMAELAAAHGSEFDRLFLESMIMHHDGAITMVYELYRSPGAAQDSDIDGFASHVESDQAAEIRRMAELLASLP